MSEILSKEEINQLTYPVYQHAAQTRRLSRMLGCSLKRRPDGLPIVTRAMIDSLNKQDQQNVDNNSGLNWGTG